MTTTTRTRRRSSTQAQTTRLPAGYHLCSLEAASHLPTHMPAALDLDASRAVTQPIAVVR